MHYQQRAPSRRDGIASHVGEIEGGVIFFVGDHLAGDYDVFDGSGADEELGERGVGG